MIKQYFVYAHRRVDTGEIFYIGKGTTKKGYPYCRAFDAKKRNVHWNRIVARHEFFAEVVMTFSEEELAFDLERELIRHFGRSSIGGVLCNIEQGGQGCSGRIVSAETRAKMSASASGKIRSTDHCRSLSVALSGKKRSAEQSAAHSAYMRGPSNPHRGRVRAPETGAKISASRKGKCAGAEHPFFGTKRPDVSEKLRGANGPAARRVVDDSTGVEYGCIADAAAALEMRPATLSRWLSGARTNKSSMRYA